MTSVKYAGTKGHPADPPVPPRHSTRFRVAELVIALRRQLGVPVRIERDLRGSMPGGPVLLRLGPSRNSPLLVLRTIAEPPPDDVQHNSVPPEKYLVYSAGYELSREIRVLNRSTVSALVDNLVESYPAIDDADPAENVRSA
jgi:hypothetical protein